jgi:ABC-type proline/glycine betaine transport system ATPase subunit
MNTGNTAQTTVNTTLVVNPANGQVKVFVNKKTEEMKKPKAVAAFAKNTRYSIYNNGGGYTGL